ncbi:uncharacterized protein EV420DRAFT_236579 [Desarmillaria tabescens]|uniref:Uncharacterized protein n=1 Tax=Armillaria tabescens TaxID=1929756 RepID=A0AA39MJT8_ARMTA|nr:uncharacterized protein EV420DRAFT_236579 [Desarmillaria tabescens]KAK0436488.1 hypothetical protein EV420DRAFT_236579 [Desarmillaria tabescens]
MGGTDVPDVVCFESCQLDAPGLHLSLFPPFRSGSLQWTNLQALTLHSLSSDFEMLLDTITMPNLDRFSLVLDKDYKFDISLFLSLLSLVERSECKLSAFTLDMTYCRGEHVQSHIEKLEYENELREFLEAIPSITELRVIAPLGSGCRHCGHILPLVIEWLLVLSNDDPSMILPHLRNLEFVWAALTTRNVMPLRSMVESRVEERVMFGDGEDGEASGDVSVGGFGDDISMGDASSETSVLSSEGDSGDPVVVSALRSLVMESRGEIDVDNFLWEWMKDVRTRGMVVYLR